MGTKPRGLDRCLPGTGKDPVVGCEESALPALRCCSRALTTFPPHAGLGLEPLHFCCVLCDLFEGGSQLEGIIEILLTARRLKTITSPQALRPLSFAAPSLRLHALFTLSSSHTLEEDSSWGLAQFSTLLPFLPPALTSTRLSCKNFRKTWFSHQEKLSEIMFQRAVPLTESNLSERYSQLCHCDFGQMPPPCSLMDLHQVIPQDSSSSGILWFLGRNAGSTPRDSASPAITQARDPISLPRHGRLACSVMTCSTVIRKRVAKPPRDCDFLQKGDSH